MAECATTEDASRVDGARFGEDSDADSDSDFREGDADRFLLGEKFCCDDSAPPSNFGVGPVIAGEGVGDGEAPHGEFVTHIGYKFAQGSTRAPVLVRQIPSRGLSYQLWPSAVALCSFLESFSVRLAPDGSYKVECLSTRLPTSTDHGSWLQGQRVLELGAGTGLVGITAARLGAHSRITDLPDVMPNLSSNAEINEAQVSLAGGSVRAQPLRWGVPDDVVDVRGRFDIVLGADIVYDPSLFAPLIQTLCWLMPGDTGLKEAGLGIREEEEEEEEGPSRREEEPRSKLRDGKPQGRRIENCKGEGSREEENGDEDEDAVAAGLPRPPLLLLAHLRRWKRDNKFFKLASKHFAVTPVHEFPPCGARKGVLIYLLSHKRR